MSTRKQYAVFLHPEAVAALGDPISPYLREGPGGPRIVCAEIDASGPLFTMRLLGSDENDDPVELEIMLPAAMVKLVMSMRGEHEIGYV